ncbi:MAG: hypothetical protein ACRDQ5_21875 [Sciscionella sp.]
MTPVPVRISQEPDDDFDDVPLPTAFTCHKLDTNEAQAVIAGQDLDRVITDLARLTGTLELYERALQESQQHSDRATKAHTALSTAIDALNPVFSGLDGARMALVTKWGDPAATHRAGLGPQPPQPCSAMTQHDITRYAHSGPRC